MKTLTHLVSNLYMLSRALTLLVAALPLACSGGDEPSAAEDRSTEKTDNDSKADMQPQEEEVDCTMREPEVLQFDQVFWSAGFKVTLGEAKYWAATPECESTALLLEGDFYNRSDEDEFSTRIVLNAEGSDYLGQLEVPEIAYQLNGKGYFYFESLTGFELSDATMFVGGATQHKAIIPLGENSTDAMISLEPIELDLNQEFESTDLLFQVTESSVRADYPPSHRNLENDTVQLRFWLDLTSKGGVENYATDHFSLKLPDGTKRYPDRGTGSGILNANETVTDYSLTFEVPYPSDGSYVLMGKSHSADDVPGELEFEVPMLPFGG